MRSPPPILPLEITDLCYAANGEKLLRDITISLNAGSQTIVLGPNGAGKSLFLRLCHGLIKPTSGSVRWRGGGDPTRRHAMVFQRPVLLRRTVTANISHALKLHGLGRDTRRQRTLAALNQAGLTDLAHRQARLLSGGEQQRLAFARAWALSPQVLFLDEPTANLDPAATRAIEAMIQGFRAMGTKVVMTTHDLAQARRLADDVLFLHQGRLVESGPAADFFTTPRSKEGQAFIAGDLLW
ncbi:MAG: ABC transporter ATP-binding protein [Alphaproteobacteria bacterium]